MYNNNTAYILRYDKKAEPVVLRVQPFIISRSIIK